MSPQPGKQETGQDAGIVASLRRVERGEPVHRLSLLTLYTAGLIGERTKGAGLNDVALTRAGRELLAERSSFHGRGRP